MAEAVTIIGPAASITSLIDLGSKIIARLHEFNSNSTNAPALFQDIKNQLPLLLEIIQKLEARVSDNSLDQDVKRSLFSTINGCARQISKIDRMIEKWSPSPQESSFKRVRKAFGSVYSEKKIMEALRTLDTYKMTLHMYSTGSACSAAPESQIQTFYELPSKQISHFVGRTGIFRELARLLEDTTVTISDRRTVILIGMGGQGKTQIALEYCRRAQASRAFISIFWIDASSENALIRSYGNIAEIVTGSRVAFPDDKSRVSYVKEFFGRLHDSWIFILDNFDRPNLFPNVKDYFPSGNSGAFIFTSRHLETERLGISITVPKMTEDEAVELLLQRAKKDATQDNIALAKVIAQRLGCFPLALDQAGSYLSSRRLPLESFLEHYALRKDVILKYIPALWEYRKTLSQSENETSISAFTTWEMSLEQVGDGNERLAISHFLTLSAFLDSTNVGDSLFRNYLVSQPQMPAWTSCLVTNGHWDAYRFQDLVASLHALSLIEGADFGGTETRFSLHPLIKDWLRLRLSESEDLEYAREAIQQVTASVEAQYNEETSLETRRILISHIDACMENEKESLHGDPDLGLFSPGDSASAFASVYNVHGRFEDARSLYVSLLDHERLRGSSHFLQTAMNLANTLRNQGQYEKAEEMYMSVLKERKLHFGPSHVDTSRALEGLAIIHSLQEKFEEADVEYQQLLQAQKKEPRGTSADMVRAIEGLANIRRHQSRYGEAEALYGRVLQVRAEDSGPQNAETLRCVEGLAIIYRHQGRLEESIRLYKLVLEHFERIFGFDHPRSLRTALNLSIAYVYQGEDAEAESIALRASQGFESTLGSEHVDTKRAAEQLAEARVLKTNVYHHVLFHMGRQAASHYELVERRKKTTLESAPPSNNESLPPKSNHLTEVHAVEQTKSHGRGIGMAGLPRITALTISKDDEPSSLIELDDDEGRRRLEFAASGKDHFTDRYYRREKSRGSPLQLFAAIGADFSSVVSLLLENYEIGPDIKDKAGQTPLSRAAANGFLDLVSFLLKRDDINADTKCTKGCTPLMYASMRGHEQIIRLLLERNDVDADAQDSYSRTALIYAAWYNQIGAARMLLSSKRVNIDSKDDNGQTSLLWAVEKNNADLVKILLDLGAQQIKTKDNYRGATPLARACYLGRESIVEALLASANLNSDLVSESFIEATAFGYEKIAKLLLNTGLVEINRKDEYGRTSLFLAARRGSREICALLLDLGADVSTENSDGKTLLLPASSYGKDGVVQLLLQRGVVEVDAADGKDRTPLSYAMEHGHEEVVKHLLDAGAKIDLTELEALERPKWVTLEKRDAMLQMVRSAQKARILGQIEP